MPARSADFDSQYPPPATPEHAADASVTALADLAEQEIQSGRHAAAAGVARLILSRVPKQKRAEQLLSRLANLHDQGPLEGDYFLALGDAHRLLGETAPAVFSYQKALTLDHRVLRAHVGLAELRLPGDSYLIWLDRFYESLAPETVIEIGVADGATLTRVRPPSIAIGVDPHPTVVHPIKTETHIFPETSDAFFARRGPDALLAGRLLGVGFIDGLHLYEQALMDFINLEHYSGPRSVILFHDTIPLDEATQRRVCDTQFQTGDVWKTVLCLKHYRPDLDVFTIATKWTGLTVVTGLNPASRVLADHRDDAVARFMDMPFSQVEHHLEGALNIVSNDWDSVAAHLKARGILA